MIILFLAPMQAQAPDIGSDEDNVAQTVFDTQAHTPDNELINEAGEQERENTEVPAVHAVDYLAVEAEDISNPILTDNELAETESSDNTDASPNIRDEAEFPYLIYVSKDSYTIAILGLDEDGEYTDLIKTFNTAIGRTSAQTRAGTYTIISRVRWIRWGRNFYSQYGIRHSGGLWFHGPSYHARDPYRLVARSYNAIGTSATAGCMRTTTGAAAWIYYHIPDGTTVIIANDSRFTSAPIPQVDASQRYDPTDPNILSESVNLPFSLVNYYD